MRLYVDLSCFNRPFDDQGQERIRLETEAVLRRFDTDHGREGHAPLVLGDVV